MSSNPAATTKPYIDALGPDVLASARTAMEQKAVHPPTDTSTTK